MSQLNVKIDYTKKIVTFSGPGTFDAKEKIKSLGPARWNPAERCWEVRNFESSFESLKNIFPEISLQEQVGIAEKTAVISSEALPSNSSSLPVPSPVTSREKTSNDTQLPKSLSVSQFTFRAREAIKKAFPGHIYIHGVISSIKKMNGRAFIDICEHEKPDEVVKCVIWQGAERLSQGLKDMGFELEADLEVMFEVEVDFNRKWSSVSLKIVNIVAEYTLSKLKAQRDITNEKLKKEGLFDNNKSLKIPFLPRRLGIITSGTGTVINDFRDSLDVSNFGFELFWCKSSVQGAAAKKELLKAIKKLEQLKELDAILIFRGGGSVSDLSVFNDYDVAQAICRCKKPVVSAIGHQQDQCSVQDVSCVALGVPKDIGRYFSDIVLLKRAEVSGFVDEVVLSVDTLVVSTHQFLKEKAKVIVAFGEGLVRDRTKNISRVTSSLPTQARTLQKKEFAHLMKTSLPISALAKQVHLMQGKELKRLSNIFSRWASRMLAESEKAISSLEKLFHSISPEQQLKRGFVLLRRVDSEKPIINGADLNEGEKVQLQFHDTVRVAQISKKEE